MKTYLLAIWITAFLSGCATTPMETKISGRYSSREINAHMTNPDGSTSNRGTYVNRLYLGADGKYTARLDSYIDGQIERGTAIGGDIQDFSRGSWTLADGQLSFRSDDVSLMIEPTRCVAQVKIQEGRWTVIWNQIEYMIEEPNHSPKPPAEATAAH